MKIKIYIKITELIRVYNFVAMFIYVYKHVDQSEVYIFYVVFLYPCSFKILWFF
jgi:hypothetical protein